MKNELAFGRCVRGVLDPGGDVFDNNFSLWNNSLGRIGNAAVDRSAECL